MQYGQHMHFPTIFQDHSADAAEAPNAFAFPCARSTPSACTATHAAAFDALDSSNDTLCNSGLRPRLDSSMELSLHQHDAAQYSFYGPDLDLEPEEFHMSMDAQQPVLPRMDACSLLPPQLDVLHPSRSSAWGLPGELAGPGAQHAGLPDGATAQLLRLQRFSCGSGAGMQFGSMPAMTALGHASSTPLTLDSEFGFPSSSNRPHRNRSVPLGPPQQLHQHQHQHQHQQRRLMSSDHEVRAELDALLADAHAQRFVGPMQRERYKFDGGGGSGGYGGASDGPGWALSRSAGLCAGGGALGVPGGLDLSAADQPSHGLGMAPWPGQLRGASGAGLPLLQLPPQGLQMQMQMQVQVQPTAQEQQQPKLAGPWHQTLRMDEAREGSGSDSPLSLSGQGAPAPFGGGARCFASPVQSGQDGGLVAADSPTAPRAPRLRWTQELHDDFLRCLHELGGEDKATPTTIWRRMKQGLALHHIKSHLQKHRLSVKQEKEALASQQQRQRAERRSSMVLLEEAVQSGRTDAPPAQLPCSFPPSTTALQRSRSVAVGYGDDKVADCRGPSSRSGHLDAVISISHNNDAPTEFKGSVPAAAPLPPAAPVGPSHPAQVSASTRFFPDWTTNPAPLPQLESTGMPIAPGSWDTINSAMQARRKVQLQLQGQVQNQRKLEHLLDQHSHHLTRLVTMQAPASSASPPTTDQAAAGGAPRLPPPAPLEPRAAGDRLQAGPGQDLLRLQPVGPQGPMHSSSWM